MEKYKYNNVLAKAWKETKSLETKRKIESLLLKINERMLMFAVKDLYRHKQDILNETRLSIFKCLILL